MAVLAQRDYGPRWKIIIGEYTGVEKFALEELYREVQSCLPYVVEVRAAGSMMESELDEHCILLGTPQNNPLLGKLLEKQSISLPEHTEGFTAACFPAPWDSTMRGLIIAGQTGAGVLYGVETFISQVVPALRGKAGQANESSGEASRADRNGIEKTCCWLDNTADFYLCEAPRLRLRGIWTWGYVIYDYRRFLDNMARLRMNVITIWNDTPPLNTTEVIEYAHSRGIRVYLGFPWGWGFQYNLSNFHDRQQITQDVLRHFEEKIAPLQPDGVYFQTLTEHYETELEGRSVAKLACELVNEISMRLLELAPGLEIQFGLHATSIQEHYSDLRTLDRRVVIVWEDAGALPYTYTPELESNGRGLVETIDYSKALAALRPGLPFGMVPKGWTSLDWVNEFEHHGDTLLGSRSGSFFQRRWEKIGPRWATINALWREYYPHALAFYRALEQVTGGNMIVQGLVEDGLFEDCIQPSVALFASMLWNPYQPDATFARIAQGSGEHTAGS